MITIAAIPRATALCDADAEQIRRLGRECEVHRVATMDDIGDISGIEFLLTILVPCGARDMDRMPALKGIVSPIIGYDWIDVDAATKRGIAVANSEAIENRESMAEATIMLLLALHYRLHETEFLLGGEPPYPPVMRRMLKGSTVGIIGFGGISRAVIERLSPWGCRILVHTRSAPERQANVEFVSLDALLVSSDSLLVLTGLSQDTRHMLSTNEFAKVRPGTLLVNTARGAIIDETALMEALRSGQIGMAALDVFEQEPLAKGHPLRSLPNLILTPHAIGHSLESTLAGPVVAAKNIVQFANGSIPLSCRNPSFAEHCN